MWPSQTQVRQFYGNPDSNGDGTADPAWERANLTSLRPPYRMVLAWDTKREVSTIRVHKKAALSLLSVLQGVNALYGGDQKKIERARMHLYGGAYNFRLMRGSTKLSMHAYGAAIDLDPVNNPLGKPWAPANGMIDMQVVRIFEDAGWVWGGRWHRPDCQHFQAVTV
jgi:hypothetical protein